MSGPGPAAAIADLLLDHVPAAVAVFDTEMRYLACSKRWLIDYGIEGQTIAGRCHYDVFPEIPDRWREIHRRALLGETLSCEEDPFPRQDGTLDWIQWKIVPWRDAGGRIGGVVLFTQMLTRFRSELIHAARISAMGTMASTLAHELNQPITAVKNYVEGVQSLLPAPDALVAEALKQASVEATHAGNIIRQLRAFVADDEEQKTVHSLSELVSEALDLAMIGVDQEGVTITVSLDSGADFVWVDRRQIEHVLIDLVRNAIEALENSATRAITITSRPENEHYVRVTLADSGKGLPPAMAEDLFRAFVSTKDGRRGIGLSICRTNVEANGGRIWHEPGPDGGCLFHFTLPKGGTTI